MIKIVNFMSCVFYHNTKIKEKKEIEIPMLWNRVLKCFGLRTFTYLKMTGNAPEASANVGYICQYLC